MMSAPAPESGPDGADKVKILVVDDHPVVRQGLRMLIGQEPDLTVCGEADSVAEALRAIERSGPDVAIVDLSLKESSGLELIKDVKIRYPKLLVLVLSMRDEAFYAERVLRAGARGYVIKEEGGKTVINGIRKILTGEIYLSEKMAAKMLRTLADGRVDSNKPLVGNLTDRELEVFELIGQGLRTREIAEKLHLSVKTIDSHREHIKGKLQLDNATDLLKYAIQWVQCQGPS